MEILSYLLTPFSDPIMLVALGIGTCAGVYVGAIPGLTGTMAVSLLVSMTFGWSTTVSLSAMIGVYVGAVFGGSRSAILLNIPGAPAAVATGFDGYPLAQKGLAAKALGVATTQSVVGGIFGVIALALLAPAVNSFAVNFSPMDYFMLAVMGILMVGALGGDSMIKGLMSACIGILLGRVGQDLFTGVARFTFGNSNLLAGIPAVVAMIGLYGFSGALEQIQQRRFETVRQDISRIIPEFKVVVKHFWLTIRCSTIGTIIGALPGAGGTIAALLAYDHARRTTKNPEVPFGEGAIEGVIAPESSNNAAVGGAFIPMMTLGVPGDAVTAIIMSALIVHGLNPGPLLMQNSKDLFYTVVSLNFLANIFLLIFGLTGIKLFAKFVEIPKGRLFPIIIILAVTGAFVTNNLLVHIAWMMLFGVLGYLLKRFKYPASPLVLGIVLGNLLETNLRNALLSFGGIGGCIASIFTRPISLVLFLFIFFSMFSKTALFGRIKSFIMLHVFHRTVS